MSHSAKNTWSSSHGFSLSQLLSVVVIGSAITLLGFNYYHALNCPDNNPDSTESAIEALSHRLEYSERLVSQNSASLQRLLRDMEIDLTSLGKETRERLHAQSIDEAVHVALTLSQLPMPPKPWDFEDAHGLTYENADIGKEKNNWSGAYGEGAEGSKDRSGRGIDDYVTDGDDPINSSKMKSLNPSDPDAFGGISHKDDDQQATFTDGHKPDRRPRKAKDAEGKKSEGDDEFDDPSGESATGDSSVFRDNLSDSDARHICSDWKNEHNVVVGVSWGSLPFQLQQKWMQYSCDYLLS